MPPCFRISKQLTEHESWFRMLIDCVVELPLLHGVSIVDFDCYRVQQKHNLATSMVSIHVIRCYVSVMKKNEMMVKSCALGMSRKNHEHGL